LAKKEYIEEEKVRITNYCKRSQREPIKFKSLGSSSRNLQLHCKGTDKALDMAKFLEAFGTTDGSLQTYLLTQVAETFRWVVSSQEPDYDKMADCCNNAMAILNGIQPKDEIEGMLAVQMIGVHNMAMETMGLAILGSHTFEGKKSNVNYATKMLRSPILRRMGSLQAHHWQVAVTWISRFFCYILLNGWTVPSIIPISYL